MDVKRDKHGRPRVYLEEDCPVAEISIESQRERGVSSALPPLYFLHVWWARRPLTVSRATVLGSLLPAAFDRKEFIQLLGIQGNPVEARARIERIHAGIEQDPGGDLYGYKRAFSNKIPSRLMDGLANTLAKTWTDGPPIVLDSFAGGGSIPFEACRMGLHVIANELNPVACIIEKATIEYPLLFGPSFATEIEACGKRIEEEVRSELADCFPKGESETELDYVWVRTVRCDRCGLELPLTPSWWLDTGQNLGFAPVLPANAGETKCKFRIRHASSDFDPDNGSIKRGMATCLRCNNVLDGDYIKREACEGRLGAQLAAVIAFVPRGKRNTKIFREVTDSDLNGVAKSESMLKKKLPDWERKGLVPPEEIPFGKETARVHEVGIEKWSDMFSPRQLLVHLTTMERILAQPWDLTKDPKKREALRVYMQFALNKCLNFNALQSRIRPTFGGQITSVFDRHDFAFIWSFGEFDGAGHLFRFGYEQIVAAYRGISELLVGSTGSIQLLVGDASSLTSLESESVHLVSIDPPYYDNVMYAECSDFFYVWMKRGIGDLFPQFFRQELTEKDLESVANVSRFKEIGKGKAQDLARRDYEAKMLSAFKEMYRVLRKDGVMTVMFTHKKVEAWDALAFALLEAGFEITASWPIHTEPENSLHQAKKNSAASTILLVCRKRFKTHGSAWWEEIQMQIDEVVRKRASQFVLEGLPGQDTFIACFGPALQIISENWPVRKKDGSVIRPDEALDRARSVVSTWFMESISEGKAETLDSRTRFYILAWHVFRAREMPYDEVRKLGISLNVEIEDLIRHKVMEKKGEYVRILKPQERFREKGLRPDAKTYDCVLDYVQGGMHAYDIGQSSELNRFHQRTGALAKEGYKEAITLLLDVLPRTDEVVEYRLLDSMWESNYRDQVSRKPRKTDPTGKLQTRFEVK